MPFKPLLCRVPNPMFVHVKVRKNLWFLKRHCKDFSNRNAVFLLIRTIIGIKSYWIVHCILFGILKIPFPIIKYNDNNGLYLDEPFRKCPFMSLNCQLSLLFGQNQKKCHYSVLSMNRCSTWRCLGICHSEYSIRLTRKSWPSIFKKGHLYWGWPGE